MAGEFGTASLAAGLVTATLAALLWLRAGLSGGPVRAARAATTASFLAAVLSGAVLEYALLRHDFSVRFVAENGGRDVPVYYTVTSLWSALDGSLLLWLIIHCAIAALLAHRASRHPARLHAYAMLVVSAVGMFFFALVYFAANPFREVRPVPLDGPGPNPLLQQHPAMGVHPPLLYLGYIGLVVPFAFALAGLLAGRDGHRWLRAARPWTLVAWSALTAGIGLGAWWSYAVLGWGGYWAWDPVENASLLPWLTATALLHTALGGARARLAWNVVLACASFLLVLLGTFLTRSGAVASVHAFTESPLGPMLLGFVLLAVAVSTVLVGWRGPGAVPRPRTPVLSRGAAVLVNGVLLLTIAAMVLVGTIFPLLSESLGGIRTAVGPRYYQRTAVPLAVVVLLVMGVVPTVVSARRAGGLRRLGVPFGIALATVAVLGWAGRPGLPALAAFGAAAFVLTGVAGQAARAARTVMAAPRLGAARLGGLLAHAGIALVAVGVAGSSAYGSSVEREIRVGEALRVDGVQVRLLEVRRTGGTDRMVVTARLERDGGGTLAPALRYFPAHDTAVTVPQIHTGVVRDVYVTLIAAGADGGSATVRLAVNPLVALLWVGGGLTAAGGLLAVPAAVRRRPAPGSAVPPAAAVKRPEVRV
ncbi:heme lyase CcmF/NrfE family subunit [Micromonospora sp. LZ34]